MPVCVLWNWSRVEGGTRLVLHDLRTYYILYCLCVITRGHSQGAAVEYDHRGAAVEADIVGAQMQLGSSS